MPHAVPLAARSRSTSKTTGRPLCRHRTTRAILHPAGWPFLWAGDTACGPLHPFGAQHARKSLRKGWGGVRWSKPPKQGAEYIGIDFA